MLKLMLLVAFAVADLTAFSVLAHEAVVDVLWTDSMVPLIRRRFPHVTAEELRAAHAHAYGGAIIQDLGYYPLGDRLFSDLTHYVRSGDFVEALLRDAQTPQEYAFALGAFTHYVTDINGHRLATNEVVPRLYPKLKEKFGSPISYEKNPAAHLKVEFGFDVLQVAKGRYAPESYHDFVGFQVSKRLLTEAFRETYGVELEKLFASLDVAIGTYRWTINDVLPEITRVAWVERQDEIESSQRGITRDRFLYRLSRASYEREWGPDYRRPGFWTRVLSAILKIVPRIGPLAALSYRMPDAEAELLFMKSFNASVDHARLLLRNGVDLENRNLDTGEPVRYGVYRRAEKAFEELLKQVEQPIPAELRNEILRYYGSHEPKSKRARQRLQQLRTSSRYRIHAGWIQPAADVSPPTFRG